MDEYLVGELQCPVCLELLNWPIILPCSHVLCRDPCAERLFVHGFIRCPVSRLLRESVMNRTAVGQLTIRYDKRRKEELTSKKRICSEDNR